MEKHVSNYDCWRYFEAGKQWYNGCFAGLAEKHACKEGAALLHQGDRYPTARFTGYVEEHCVEVAMLEWRFGLLQNSCTEGSDVIMSASLTLQCRIPCRNKSKFSQAQHASTRPKTTPHPPTHTTPQHRFTRGRCWWRKAGAGGNAGGNAGGLAWYT